MHSCIVEEEKGSYLSWRRHSMQILYQVFSQSEVLILGYSGSPGRWYLSENRYLRSDSDMLFSNIDLYRKPSSCLSMISWFFLEIAWMLSEISQKLPRKSTIVIHHRDIFLTLGIDICRDFRDGYITSQIRFLIERQRTIRDNYRVWIIFSQILKMYMGDSSNIVDFRVMSSIHRRISVDLHLQKTMMEKF